MTARRTDDLTLYFDRQGKPIEVVQWADYSQDANYRFLARDTLPNGRWVATIWIGLNDLSEPPRIFETTVFSSPPEQGERLHSLDCYSYSTEAEALAGHAGVVKEWSSPT